MKNIDKQASESLIKILEKAYENSKNLIRKEKVTNSATFLW